MKIEYNEETMTLSIDTESYKRIAQGTSFQSGINCLAMMLEILTEGDNELADNLGIYFVIN